jgi:DNA-binding NtrC family response regulator
LVIDDDEAVLRTVVRALERAGHSVRSASNGKKALRLVEEERPELVVTDINMPEMDGMEVISDLTTRGPPIPVVAMSGGGRMPREVLLNTAGALGALRSLAKPFTVEELTRTVERALGSLDPEA